MEGKVRMTVKTIVPRGIARMVRRAMFALVIACLPARCLFAISCGVVAHVPPTEADKALIAAKYAKAESLYKANLSAHPGDAESIAGLVHSLLDEQKVQDAADTVASALAASPNSPPLITLRGEVEFRQGTPWLASHSAAESFKLDPCNPRTQLLLADLARIGSRYATAQKTLITAHELDPEDQEIRQEWAATLPIKQRISEIEAYLAAPAGDDAERLTQMRAYLDRLKKLEIEPHNSCHLVSSTASTSIPLVYLMSDATHVRAFGLEVKLNDHNFRLQIDTGAGGLVVNRSVAERAGLKSFSQIEIGGIGDQGDMPAYTAYADSIRIGSLEFQNCEVQVLDSRHGLDEVDGLVGMDVFAPFLVTLDYPIHRLLLGPLPPRPGEPASATPTLNTAGADEADSEEPAPDSASKDASPKDSLNGQLPPPKTPVKGPYDRYIAPEMKDYAPVYRVGHDLILPANLNGKSLKLFIMDTGAWTTTISPQAAREVTKVREGANVEVKGISGKVNKVYTADDVTFNFAHLSQKAVDVYAFDTSKISQSVGMEISGFIGATTLMQLTIHIDYRDGLVKFEYDPHRGYNQ